VKMVLPFHHIFILDTVCLLLENASTVFNLLLHDLYLMFNYILHAVNLSTLYTLFIFQYANIKCGRGCLISL
jgi:hypothetical protein